MPTREKVPEARKPSAGQVGNVIARIAPRIPFTNEECEAITNDPKVGKSFDREVDALFAKFHGSKKMVAVLPSDVLELNGKLYHNLFGKVPDFSGIALPKTEGGGPFLTAIVAKELVEWTGGSPIEGVFHARKKLYPTWKYTGDSLDAVITVNERTLGNGTYAFACSESITPDADLMNLSANDITSRKLTTMMALEYLLFETAYFLKHGVHLDPRTWTLLSGSRNRGGRVPLGDWRDGSSNVYWRSPSSCGPSLGSRKVWV